MEENKKYRLTTESILLCFGKKLYRIEALKDFGDIRKGEKGGYVESEKNLSQKGNCWIYDDAMVFDDARVYDDVQVYDNAKIYGKACIKHHAIVRNNAQVYGDAYVFENAQIYEYATVYGTAYALGNARIRGNACVRGDARVTGDAIVYGDAIIEDYCVVRGNACITGNVTLKKREDYVTFYEWWSRDNRIITWTRPNNLWRVGTFYGTSEELVKQAYKDNEKFGRQYEHFMKSIEAIIKEEDGE